MTESAFPFDTGPGSAITALQFRSLAQGAAFNVPGVIIGELNELAAFGDSTPSTGKAGVVKMPSGRAFCLGTLYENSAQLTLDVDANATGSVRWDALVIRFDWVNEIATAMVLTGTSDVNGPALTSSRSTTYDVLVAFVKVAAGATTLGSGAIYLCRDRWATQTSDAPIGSSVPYYGKEATVPKHYILENGTILDWHYFPKLWHSGILPAIGDDGGLASFGTVGQNITFPDSRGRVIVGKNDMGGFPGPLSAPYWNALGTEFGEETHDLLISELARHAHDDGSLGAASSGAHAHEPADTSYDFVVHKAGASNNPHTTAGADSSTGVTYTAATESAGAHTHSVTGTTDIAGGGDPFNVVQPSLVANRIMKIA